MPIRFKGLARTEGATSREMNISHTVGFDHPESCYGNVAFLDDWDGIVAL